MIRSLIFCILVYTPPFAIANSEATQEGKESENVNGRRVQKPVEAFEKTRNQLSRGLIGLSSRIDQFFSNDFVDTENNDSQIKVTLETTVEDNESPAYDFLINTYLRLPLTEQKFQLFLTSLNNDSDDSLNDEDNNVFGAGFRFEFLKKASVNIQTDAGVAISDRLDPFVKFRLRNTVNFTEWTNRYVQTLYWFDSKGFEFLSEAFWDKQMNPVILFRIYTALKWMDLDESVAYEHNYNIIHQFDMKHAIIYKLGLEGLDEPVMHVDNYITNVTLKTLIYKDWLSLSLSPGAVWRKEDGFKSRAQVMFALDMLIGST